MENKTKFKFSFIVTMHFLTVIFAFNIKNQLILTKQLKCQNCWDFLYPLVPQYSGELVINRMFEGSNSDISGHHKAFIQLKFFSKTLELYMKDFALLNLDTSCQKQRQDENISTSSLKRQMSDTWSKKKYHSLYLRVSTSFEPVSKTGDTRW